MTTVHPFHFVSGERVLGAQPESGEEREMHYYVNDDSVAKLLGATLSPLLADLVDVAAAIHIADRLAIRQGSAPETWRRQFRVDIPVRCLNDWMRPEVLESLCRVLAFLTGDGWAIRFSARPARLRTSESQTHLFTPEGDEQIRVSLFSGGLDAFAGTIAHLEQRPDEHLVCVSGTPNNRQGHHQKIQVDRLRALSRRSITHIRVPSWLESSAEIPQEPTRRTRGILFLILGAVSALSAGVHSRSVHPSTLILVARFLEAITGEPFFIENPAVFQTKAEMCKHPSVQTLMSTIGETFSCDGFPVQRSKKPQCGVCTSCILRRHALYSAGLSSADATGYACDLYGTDQTLNPRRLRGLIAMDWQVVRLSEALQDGWTGLMREFPDLRQTCMALSVTCKETTETVQQRLVRLYTRHVEEWKAFPPRALLTAQRKAA
jgi:Queuosine biosynthesis protein QueC